MTNSVLGRWLVDDGGGQRHIVFALLAFLLSIGAAQELNLAQCKSAFVNISQPLKVVAHLERPFVMRRDALDNASVAALTRPDLDGYSLDVLAAVSTRFGVAFTMKMLTKVELERWDNKRDLVENKMFSRSVDMSANVLTRKDNRRQNLPPLMSGTVKAVLKHYEGFGRIDNYTRLVALAHGDQMPPPSPVEDDDNDAVQRAAQLDAAWKFGSVENSEAWHFLKRSKLMEMRTLYQRVWDERRRRNLPVNRTDGLAKLNRSTSDEPYVFFDESIMADYHAALDDQLYTIDIDPKMSEPIEYVFGTAFDMHDDVKRNLTCIFLQLADDGTLDRLKEKWFSGAAALRSSVLLLLASAGAMALFLRNV